jgi:hypothetical protein
LDGRSVSRAAPRAHAVDRQRQGSAMTSLMMIDCPKTGLPVRTGIRFATLAREPGTLVTLHCARCGELHQFSYAEASIEMSSTKV